MTVVSLDDKIAYMDAELMELADMQDLGSCGSHREGSNPSFRMNFSSLQAKAYRGLFSVIAGNFI